jgi:hypothetical protein
VTLGRASFTEKLQALLVAPTVPWKQLAHLLVAAFALVLSVDWRHAVVVLFPASACP